MGSEFACGIEHGVGDRTDVRVNAPEIAQHVEMQRRGLDGLGPALAQTVEMPFGGGQLGVRNSAFSASSLRASLTSPDMKTPKAIRRESIVRLWKAESSSAPSVEN